VRPAALLRRLRALVLRGRVEREMDDELALHLELQARHLERGGLAPAAARRAAVIAFGGMEPVREHYRDARGVRPIEDLLQDVRYALRSFRRRPLFTAVTAVTIALGVGAATSIYSVVDGILLRPLPFPEPEHLTEIFRTRPDERREPRFAGTWDRGRLSLAEYRELRNRATAFAGVAVSAIRRETLIEGGGRERIVTHRTSPQMLTVLGVRPVRGRMFTPEEDRPGAPGVVLISYEAWQTRYGGDPAILSRSIAFEDRAFAIVGVLPPRLALGRTSENGLGPPLFWLPAGQREPRDYDDRTARVYRVIARLAPGASMERATAEVRTILGDPRDAGKLDARLVEWQRDQTREARRPLYLLLAAAGLLLLIACVNVATLLLGEAVSREHEMAARLALGAGRRRVIRQLITESVVLAALGGALGIAAAWAGTSMLIALAPLGMPGVQSVAVDLRVVGIALVAVTVTGVAFGLAPALALSTTSPATLLRVGTGQSRRGRERAQRVLVAAELSLAVVLLAGAGLLSRSFAKITAVDPGFRAQGLVYVISTVPSALFGDSIAVHRIYENAVDRVAALPGGPSAAIVTDPPFVGGTGSIAYAVERDAPAGIVDASTPRRRVHERGVGPGYFRLLGMPLLAGRDLTPADRWGAPPVVIVSESFVRQAFPDGAAVGRHIYFRKQWWTIVGVVGDIREQTLTAPTEPGVYTPFAQQGDISSPQIVIGGSRTPSMAEVRGALEAAHPGLVLSGYITSRELVERSFADDRFRTTLMSIFAVLAGVLAVVGMYGITARAVARRTRDIGIRLALGASTAGVVRHCMRQTLAGAMIGLALGLALAAIATRALAPFLFGVTVADPLTYGATIAAVMLAAVVASWLPARRAGNVEIVQVLRAD
jgi:putative ABC transport system permease protein